MFKIRKRTLRWKLTGLLGVVVVLVAGVIVALSAWPLRNTLMNQIDQELISASNRSLSSVTDSGGNNGDNNGGSTAETRPPGILSVGQSAGTLNVYVANGIALAGYFDESGEFHQLTVAQATALLSLSGTDSIETVSVPGLGNYRAVMTVGTTLTSLGQINVINVIALPIDGVSQTVWSFVLTASLIALAIALVLAAAGAFLIKKTLAPLQTVAKTAESIASQPLDASGADLSERVPDDLADPATEVGKVGQSVNVMLEHIDQAFSARDASEHRLRSFVADASHELRTPLASIQGYSELVARVDQDLSEENQVALERIQSEAKRMSHLVEDLLTLARLDNDPQLDAKPFEVTSIVFETVNDAHVVGPDHTWNLDFSALPDPEEEGGEVLALGDEAAFRQIVMNLVANARIHTPAGTSVTVAVSVDENNVRLEVADDGPGIAPEIQDKLFDRFVKADSSRTPGKGSSGLGLSIVRSLAEAQGGQVWVESTPGDTRFVVELPRATAADLLADTEPDNSDNTAPDSSDDTEPKTQSAAETA